MTAHWRSVARFAEQFRACEVGAGTSAVVLSETTSRPATVETARLALESMGVAVVDVVLTTPANPGPLPIRSTGASQAIRGHVGALAAMRAVDFVADCTVEGLLHAPELGDILGAGSRVLMISNEHPENFERWPHDPTLADRVGRGVEMLQSSGTMHVTSAAGTDVTVALADAFSRGITWMVHRTRFDRALARRSRAGLPCRGERERHARAGAGRCQPHVQAVRRASR